MMVVSDSTIPNQITWFFEIGRLQQGFSCNENPIENERRANIQTQTDVYTPTYTHVHVHTPCSHR